MFTLKQSMAAMALGLMAIASTAQAVVLEDLKKDGPYTIVSEKLGAGAYGGATIHTPNTGGPYALVAVCPGFVSPEAWITNMSKRLATHGFAVITISTKTLLDFPPSRAAQILSALDVGMKVNTGNAAGKIDTSRLVASGWSMGGGGALEAGTKTPKLKAVVAYAAWSMTPSMFRTLTVPTIQFGATGDIIAPVNGHQTKFHDAIPATTKKVLAVLQGDNHFFVLDAAEPVSYSNIAWVKRFADNDAQYGEFLKNLDPKWSSYKSNGPF